MSKMTKIKIFLASSFKGIEEERVELGARIDNLNEKYYEQYGVYFHLIMAEDKTDGGLASLAEDSDLFYIVICEEAPQEAEDEFNAAYEHFRNSDEPKKPRLCAYFKEVKKGKEQDGSVPAFKERLRKGLKQYTKEEKYVNIDTFLNKFYEELMEYKPNEFKYTVKDSKLYLNDVEVEVTFENFGMVLDNQYLGELKSKRKDKIKELEELDGKMESTSDKEEIKSYVREQMCIETHIDELNKEIQEIEKDILDTLKVFLEKADSGDMTPELKAAWKYLEEGNLEGAKKVINIDKFILESDMNLTDSEIKRRQAQKIINELPVLVQIYKLDRNNPNRFDEIKKAYEQAIKLEEDRNIKPRKTLLDYSEYLSSRNENKEAIKYAEKYLNYLDYSQAGDSERLAALDHLAKLYCSTMQYNEAKELHERKISILTKLTKLNPQRYSSDLVYSYQGLARIAKELGLDADVIYYYEQALDITLKAAEEDPASISIYWAYQDLIRFYEAREQYPLAEPYYRQKMETYKRLSEKNYKEYRSDYADACIALADFLEKLGDEEKLGEANELYERGFEILREVAEELPGKYAEYADVSGKHYTYRTVQEFADYYAKQAKLFEKREMYDKAEVYYRKGVDVALRLAEEEPDIVAHQAGLLMWSYHYLLRFLESRGLDRKRKEVLLQQLKIYGQLVKKDPSIFRYYARIYVDLAELLEKREQYRDAYELQKQGIDTLKQLSEDNKQLRLSDCSDNYTKLAKSMERQKKYELAEEWHRQRRNVAVKFAEENPEHADVSNLRWSFKYLIDFLRERGQDFELELRQKLEIYRKIAEKNQNASDDFAGVCIELAMFLENKEQYDEEEVDRLYEQGLSIYQQLADEDPKRYVDELGRYYTTQADSLAKRGKYTKAENYYKQRLELALKIVEENPSEANVGGFLGQSFSNLIRFYMERAQSVELGNILKQQMDVKRNLAEKGGKNYYSSYADACVELAEFHKAQNDDENRKEAETLYRQAIDLLKQYINSDKWAYNKFERICLDLYRWLFEDDKVAAPNEDEITLDDERQKIIDEIESDNSLLLVQPGNPKSIEQKILEMKVKIGHIPIETVLRLLNITLPGDVDDLHEIEYP